MADFTSTTHATWQPDIWANEVQAAFESKIVGRNVVKQGKIGAGAAKGDVLHFPLVSNLTVNDIADNADIVGQAPTESEVTVTLNKKKETSVYIQKHLIKNLSSYDFRREYTGKIGYALAKQIDSDLYVTMEAGTQSVGAIDASATDITDQMIRDAMELLDLADVPEEKRVLILFPDQRSAILGVAKFVEMQTIGIQPKSPITTGQVPDIYGYSVNFTNILHQFGTSPNFYRKGFLVQEEGAILALPDAPDVEYNYVARRKAYLLSGDVLYGSAIFRNNAFVIINTDQV